MQHITTFLAYIQGEKRYSENTVQAYKKDLEQFFLFLDNKALLAGFVSFEMNQITHLQIRQWLASLNEKEQIKAQSINRKISSLKSFFKYLLKTGVVVKSPMTKVISPKSEQRLPTFVNESNMDTLLRHVEFPDSFKGRTERLIIEVLYQTGLRRAELVGLKLTNINFYDATIKVIGKGNKERIVPIINSLCDLIKLYIDERKALVSEEHGFLFVLQNGKQVYDKYVYLVVKQYLGEATTLEKRGPHVLRHTFATHLLNGGADLNAVKELLGHANLAATQIYTHNTIDRLKEVHKKAHPKA
jgi:integrase/recombinase XerC